MNRRRAVDDARLAACRSLYEALESEDAATRLTVEMLLADMTIDLFANLLAVAGARQRDEVLARLNKHEWMRAMQYRVTVVAADDENRS